MTFDKKRLHLILPTALKPPHQQMHWQLIQKEAPLSAFLDELATYYESLTGYQEALSGVAQAFCELLEIEPEHCEQTTEALVALRLTAQEACIFLRELSPVQTQQVHPYGAIAGLYQLDYFCTHMALSVVRFGRICHDLTLASVQWHIRIRADMPRLLTSYENAISMIEALAHKVIEVEQKGQPLSPPQGQEIEEKRASWSIPDEQRAHDLLSEEEDSGHDV